MFTADEGQSQPVWAAAGSLVELEFTGRCEIKGGMCGVVVVVSGGGWMKGKIKIDSATWSCV